VSAPPERLRWLAAWWLLQTAVLLVAPLLLGAEPGELLDVAYLGGVVLVSIVFAALQAVFLLPLGRPRLRTGRPRPFWPSASVAGLLVAMLVVSVGFVGLSVVELFHGLSERQAMDSDAAWPIVLAAFLLSWAVANPLILRYARGRDAEDALARISRGLFRGTVVDLLLLVPVDVMVRRRSHCYCAEGSYFALVLWIAVATILTGPAVLLLLLRRDRRSSPGALRKPFE
jgi:hypothetical protein